MMTLTDIANLGGIILAAWVIACGPGVVRYLVSRRGRGGRS